MDRDLKLIYMGRNGFSEYSQVAGALVYLGWIYEEDEIRPSKMEKKKKKLSHVLQKSTPVTRDLMELYFAFLKTSEPALSDKRNNR